MRKLLFWAALVTILAGFQASAQVEDFLAKQMTGPQYGQFKNKYMSSDSFISLGNRTTASVKIVISADGTYYFVYSEGPMSGAGSFTVNKTERRQNRWRMDGSVIVFEGLGRANPADIATVDVQGKNIVAKGFLLKFDQDVVSAGLKDKVASFVAVLSTSMP